MCYKDDSLEELACLAQQYPRRSLKRQQILTQLTQKLIQSNQWFIKNTDNFPTQFHQEILEEAKQEVILEMCQKIDDYDPQRATLMTWLNFLLNKRYKDYRLKYLGITKRQENNQKVIIYTQLTMTLPEDLESDQTEGINRQNLLDFIEEDSTETLRKEYLPHHPEINMREILLERLDGKTWESLADLWNVSPKTLSSFFSRKLETLKPFFKTHFDG